MRFYDLGGESYWYDEVIMVRVAQEDIWSILEGGRPPLYIVLAHFWIKLFGTSEVATRSLSALAGVLSIPLMYAVGRRLFDMRIGLISAFLMAISQFQIYYSQDFRYYSLFALMTLFSFYFYVLLLDTRKILYFVFYVIASILLFYTHTFGVFILFVQNLYFLLRWNKYRAIKFQWIVSQIFVFLAILSRFIPSIQKISIGKAGPMSWLPDPGILSPLITIQYYIGAGLDYPSWETIFIGITFFIVATVAYITWQGKEKWLSSLRGVLNKKGFSGKESELLLVGCWFLLPIILPLILSKIFGPMYHNRYMISASPAFYILLAFIITKVSKVIPEFISLGLIVIVITPGLYEFYVTPVREQWREAAALVEKNGAKNDVIIVAGKPDGQNVKNFNWYYRGNLNECGIPYLDNDEEIKSALEKCISGSDRFWLVVRKEPFSIQKFMNFFFRNDQIVHLITQHEFTKVSVYLFGLSDRS
ncbi:MAG: glycosyltransferase family 39 protein [Thermodesulfobacteriota bacterium]